MDIAIKEGTATRLLVDRAASGGFHWRARKAHKRSSEASCAQSVAGWRHPTVPPGRDRLACSRLVSAGDLHRAGLGLAAERLETYACACARNEVAFGLEEA